MAALTEWTFSSQITERYSSSLHLRAYQELSLPHFKHSTDEMKCSHGRRWRKEVGDQVTWEQRTPLERS